MHSEAGLVEGVVISFQDKTEQIQAENELVEQKSLFESLFINAPEAIILVGINRDIKMVNPAFTELFGYQLNEVNGKTTQMLYAEEHDFIERGNAYNGASQDI
jgi:PAS domain-containing protein